MPGGAGNLGEAVSAWPFSAGKQDGSARTEPVSIWKKKRIVGTEAGKRTASKAGAGTKGENKKEIGPSTLENAQETKKEHLESGQDLKQQGIYISVAPSPRAELEETVRLIRRMVREEKMRYQDFAVLTGDLSIYGTYAREIFEKCGVPYFVDENIPY